jgi:hypothetical protein
MNTLHHQTAVAIDRRGAVRRRDFLKTISAAGAAAGTIAWSDVMTLNADELRRQGKACILLWMQGGPSQFETFSPAPGHENGGETKAISTSVAGIQISENLPNVAKAMEHICLIRSMTGKEGSHPRATYLMHTGYLPTASVKYPSFGANAAHQLGDPASELPGFVRVGRARDGGGGGLLGVNYDPFVITEAGRLPDNAALPVSDSRFQKRLRLLGYVDDQYAAAGAKQEVADHRSLYEQTARMILSPKMETFDLSQEPGNVRSAYGDSTFGRGCLLARRLVETGVTFVEITDNGWDTHQDNFAACRTRCESIDKPYAALLRDLDERGMLENTLVIWMGEFGRTPRINPRSGRDHYPRAFSVALAGGGMKGGQVIGRTDRGGTTVEDRPVAVPDLFRTFCQALSIDGDHANMSAIGRPIKIVDGGEPVMEAFG